MTLTDRIKMALTSSTSSTTNPNGAGAIPAPPTPGGGAAGLLEKHKQVTENRGGARPGAGRPRLAKSQVGAASPSPAIPLYSPETGQHVQRALFGTMAVLSKRDAWSLADDEAKMLGPLTSECLNQFTPGGEKWVCLSVLAVSMLSVFTAKAQIVQAEIKAEKVLSSKKIGVPSGVVAVPHPAAPAKTSGGGLDLPPFITDAKPE
jgi:hypothetical protein